MEDRICPHIDSILSSECRVKLGTQALSFRLLHGRIRGTSFMVKCMNSHSVLLLFLYSYGIITGKVQARIQGGPRGPWPPSPQKNPPQTIYGSTIVRRGSRGGAKGALPPPLQNPGSAYEVTMGNDHVGWTVISGCWRHCLPDCSRPNGSRKEVVRCEGPTVYKIRQIYSSHKSA